MMRTIPSAPRSTYRRRSTPLDCDTPNSFMKPIPFPLPVVHLVILSEARPAGTGRAALSKHAEAKRDPDVWTVAAGLGRSGPERLAVVSSEGTGLRAEGDSRP